MLQEHLELLEVKYSIESFHVYGMSLQCLAWTFSWLYEKIWWYDTQAFPTAPSFCPPLFLKPPFYTPIPKLFWRVENKTQNTSAYYISILFSLSNCSYPATQKFRKNACRCAKFASFQQNNTVKICHILQVVNIQHIG